jgi:hypothetical protein
MIVWGSGGDALNLGTLQTKRCDVCEKERPFNVILQYRYWGLYWIFSQAGRMTPISASQGWVDAPTRGPFSSSTEPAEGPNLPLALAVFASYV